jgi:hypothetical protein
LVVNKTIIGIASFGVDYDCNGLNAISSIRRHIRWIKMSMSHLEGMVMFLVKLASFIT